jgi:hypothetical protein
MGTGARVAVAATAGVIGGSAIALLTQPNASAPSGQAPNGQAPNGQAPGSSAPNAAPSAGQSDATPGANQQAPDSSAPNDAPGAGQSDATPGANQQTPGSGSSELRTQANITLSGVSPEFVSKVSNIQQTTGIPLIISSGKRSSGTPGISGRDPHQLGQALDISYRSSNLSDNTVEPIVKAALSAGINGIGIEGNHLHLDARENKTLWGSNYKFDSAPEWAKKLTNWSNGGARRDNTTMQAASTTPNASAAPPGGAEAASTTPNASAAPPGGAEVASTTPDASAAPPGGAEVASSPVATPISSTAPSTGTSLARASMGENAARAAPPIVNAVMDYSPQDGPNPGALGSPQRPIDQHDPGPIEPEDAGERYAKLFAEAA